MNLEELCHAVQAKQQAHGLSLQALGRLCGIGASNLSRQFRGKNCPSFKSQARLQEWLEKTPCNPEPDAALPLCEEVDDGDDEHYFDDDRYDDPLTHRRLWAAIIAQARADATAPNVVKVSTSAGVTAAYQQDARDFLHNRERLAECCTALNLDLDWFCAQIKRRYPPWTAEPAVDCGDDAL